MMKYTNKDIPLSIKDQVEAALAHYPELKDTPISFKFKKEIKKSHGFELIINNPNLPQSSMNLQVTP